MPHDGTSDVEVGDARLDDDALAVEVDLEDPVHTGERHDNPSCDRSRSSGKAGSGAPRDERDTLAAAGADDGLHVLRRPRKDDELRNRSVPGEPVALVHAQLLGLGDDVLVSQSASELVRE
jgi:hypothetical protein